MNQPLQIEQEVLSIGIATAELDHSGIFLSLDFALLQDPSKALRVVFPAANVEMLAEQLTQLAKAMKDPTSGLTGPAPH